jgi:hypothetical protein
MAFELLVTNSAFPLPGENLLIAASAAEPRAYSAALNLANQSTCVVEVLWQMDFDGGACVVWSSGELDLTAVDAIKGVLTPPIPCATETRLILNLVSGTPSGSAYFYVFGL